MICDRRVRLGSFTPWCALSTAKTLLLSVLCSPFVGCLTPNLTFAQVVPAEGTLAPNTGAGYAISGGQVSRDGANQFHTFSQFGLTGVDNQQVANFIARDAQIQNILARVNGGSPSVINGLLQVSGSNANLYLMNPAGILFGSGASLNVPASFTATTATGIGFGDRWFSAAGSNNTADLIGSPSQFAFAVSQPGAIVNAGNLAVGQGQSLRLLGGTVVNTGHLTAPGGEITIAAVPGENLVRLSQSGSLLSLEFQPISSSIPPSLLPTPSLAQLLTGGNLSNATGLSINPDGTVRLTSTRVEIPTTPSTVITSGSLSVSSSDAGNAQINLLGTQVGVVSGVVDASGLNNGGTVRIGGDYQGNGNIPNAIRTVVNQDSIIRADAKLSGNGGRVIVWADQDTAFSGTITARGGTIAGNGGFVEVSGKQNLQYRGNVDTTASNGNEGTLLLDPTDIIIAPGGSTTGFTGQALFADLEPTIIFQNQLESLSGNTNFILEASNSITIQTLDNDGLAFQSGAGAITFTSGGAFSMNQDQTIFTNGRSLTISAASVTAGNIDTPQFQGSRNGAVTIFTTNGDIAVGRILTGGFGGNNRSTTKAGDVVLSAQGSINSRFISTYSAGSGNAGNVTLTSQTGNINVGEIDSGSSNGNGGEILAQAAQNITITDLIYTASGSLAAPNPRLGNGNGGNVTLKAGNSITTEEIITSSINGSSGCVTLDPRGDIQVAYIDAQGGTNGRGGTVSITTDRFFRATDSFIDQNGINASISTAGGQPGSSITIQHGGNGITPFIVGNGSESSASQNGTFGTITTGRDNQLESGNYFFTYRQTAPSGIIQIITARPPIPEEKPVEALKDSSNIPLELCSFGSLAECADEHITRQYDRYLDRATTPIKSLVQSQEELREIERQTGIRPALIYAFFAPIPTPSAAIDRQLQPPRQLSDPNDIVVKPGAAADTSDYTATQTASGVMIQRIDKQRHPATPFPFR
jgi:filamentous hemagglutinin family protein